MTLADLTLDAEHRYYLGSRPLPSVTQVIASCGLVDASWFTEESRRRGSDVHAAAHYFDEDDLASESVRPEIRPYLDAYVSFRQVTGFYPVLSEQKVYHSQGFAGTLDRVGWLNDRLVQIDLKTGAIPRTAGLQTAAYEMALEERVREGEIDLPSFPEGRYALQLSANGTFRLCPVDKPGDCDTFLACLRVYQFAKGK